MLSSQSGLIPPVCGPRTTMFPNKMLKTKNMKPIAFFDFETTGTDVAVDKIVEISIVIFSPDFSEIINKKTMLINPGIPIPKEATEIHGITDEMVKDQPLFPNIAKGVLAFIEGCDMAGYNINNFDKPLFAEEFARCGINWPAGDVLFIDAMQIFHSKEKRDLSGAMKFYCNEDHEGAHAAEIDNIATAKVLQAQLKTYADLGAMDREQLAKFCQPNECMDIAGKIIKNADGKWVYGFGKDKGKRIKENPGFGQWMLKSNFTTNTKDCIRKILDWHK